MHSRTSYVDLNGRVTTECSDESDGIANAIRKYIILKMARTGSGVIQLFISSVSHPYFLLRCRGCHAVSVEASQLMLLMLAVDHPHGNI